MPTLPESRIATLLAPYLSDFPTPPALSSQLSTYLDLLLRWNARTNLTAIREPEEIVCRHFGESLFCGIAITKQLPATANLLDFGSGAGFPGLPIQLLLPQLHVTLAESQGKKAAFLREAVRTLHLPTEIWADRAESMPSTRQFDTVTLRAVDRMDQAVAAARPRVAPGGLLVTFTSGPETPDALPIPGTEHTFLSFQRF